jgi:hypothetical protein
MFSGAQAQISDKSTGSAELIGLGEMRLDVR